MKNKMTSESESVTTSCTKENILQTALSMFAQNGYEAVSIKDITDALSLTKAALYKHYKNKREILDSIIGRMELEDGKRAAEYEMPVHSLDADPEEYGKTQLDSIIAFADAQFDYWTEDPFASRFRRMLTLEQYRDKESAERYNQYLCAGPLAYMKDVFTPIVCDAAKAEQKAVEFYAPMFLLYGIYDGSDDKAAAKTLLTAHLNQFKRTIFKGE